jgi:WD40 repeat protein
VGSSLIGDVSSATFSPDGKYIVMGRFICMFDAQKGQPIGDLVFFGDWYDNSAYFSSDGKYIVTSSLSAIKIWKFTSIEELIESTKEQFKDRPLTPEERKKYYLD